MTVDAIGADSLLIGTNSVLLKSDNIFHFVDNNNNYYDIDFLIKINRRNFF